MVMSGGLVHVFQAPPHAEILHAEAKPVAPVTGSLKGSSQVLDSVIVSFSGMTGKVGKIKFTGSGNGEILGNQFEGGTLQLTGKNGTLSIDIFGAPIKHASKGAGTFNSVMIIENATGNYAGDDGAVIGSAGNFAVTIQDLIKWYKGAREAMTDKADVDSLSDLARFILEAPGG